jgi:hypothetical protein
VNKKRIESIIFIVIVMALVLIAGYFVLIKKSETITPPLIDSKNYSTEPFAECVECRNGETWDNKPCCTDSFDKDCTSKNGVNRFFDLHPMFTTLRGCFRKAPDTGKACSSGTDCLSGVCDLESAIKSDKCSLIKKEFTGERNRYNQSQEFFTATYSCSSDKPGACAETIRNEINPGGANHTFNLVGKTIVEVLEPGMIR